MTEKVLALVALICACMTAHGGPIADANAMPPGVFEDQSDIGRILHPGSLDYDSAKGTYTLSGNCENMSSTADAFHFVWKKVTGDVSLSADISFPGKPIDERHQAVLMIRQSLDANSVYADAALRGDGLTALQYRDEKGVATRQIRTREIERNAAGLEHLRIEKRGNFVYLFLRNNNKELHFSGASTQIALPEPYYVGIGFCSLGKDAADRAIFADVDLKTDLAPTAKTRLYSMLETLTIASTDRQVVYVAPEHFEAPNWTRDGKTFLFNRDGRIYRLPVAGGEPAMIDTGFANRCNNDHGISPDQTLLAISDQSQAEHQSVVYTVPIGGGVPRRVTQNSPSYWHGWSPDGNTLAFVGQRNGDFDIYTVPVFGGEETRLTTAKGLDDGPEYSPDGRYIYFNSERTGHMQIWRMRSDGSGQEQVLDDQWNDWFPHISPDAKWIVFLSYEPEVKGHPPNQDVMLRALPFIDDKGVEGKLMHVKVAISVMAKLFGGQGTINVPSWSPDSKQFAFVSYALLPDDGANK
jgi:TolB protein